MNDILIYLTTFFPKNLYNRVYLTGGVVRDILLGQKISDIDLAAALSPAEFTALGFRLVAGRSTSPIWFRHETGSGNMEVTPLRDSASLRDDLQRRDFCCNALAMNLAGDIIDPLGGRDDLNVRILRACSPLSLIEDPLRIFRALRFQADGWNISAETEALIRSRDWTKALSAVPVERFSREMFKALGMRSPERFFDSMLEYAVGWDFLPELFRMPTIPAGPLIHHPEGDLLTHSTQVLQRVAAMSTDPLIRFCAFFHDIGKLATSPALYPKHHGHDQAGFVMAAEFCRRLRLPADHGRALAWVSRLHGTFNLWDQLRDATKLKVAKQAITAGIVDILPLVAAADKAGGREPAEWQMVVSVAGMSARELGIDPDMLEEVLPKNRAGMLFQSRILKLRG
jgi:tRNA nucleotidyltransferase (CCA-adding enzyme)